MIGRETRMLLRHYLEQGASKSALARQLRIGRDTIHRWIRSGALDREVDAAPVRYGPRPPVPTKLDPYKGIIETRLTAYPALSAVRLLAEIRAAGYTGGYSQLTALVRQLRPAPAPAPVLRFETPAGRQAQVDFARFTFPWGVRYALLVVLGYSRLLSSTRHERVTRLESAPNVLPGGNRNPEDLWGSRRRRRHPRLIAFRLTERGAYRGS